MLFRTQKISYMQHNFLTMTPPASAFERDEGGYLYGRSDEEPFPSYPLDVLSMSFVNRLNALNITEPTLSKIESELQRVQNDGLVDETGALLGNELYQLSMKEREEVFHDIHGVAEIVEETPDFCASRLEQLELDLLRIPDKDAYNQARAKSPEYVTSRKSGLMFLRAARFDTREAADRMVRYYKEKLLVFGSEPLARDICLTDLSSDAMACLETGYRQLLPGRDRAGRAILVGIGNLRNDAYLQWTTQVFWYIVMAALEDEETQKRGFVIIAYYVGSRKQVDRRGSYNIARLSSWMLPMRAVGLHGCTDDPRQRTLMNLTVMIIGTNMRFRSRIHFGTDLECQYQMMTFGISNKLLPVNPDGVISLDNHNIWIQRRRLQESSMSEPTRAISPELHRGAGPKRIAVPGSYDILLGRGKLIQEHTGNIRFRHLIEKNRATYEKATKNEKTFLATRIVDIVNDGGGRFLKEDPSGWTEVTDDTARDKVSHSFRNKRLQSNSDNLDTATKGRSIPRKAEDLRVLDSKRARVTGNDCSMKEVAPHI